MLSRPSRQYCSSQCRYKAWDAANRFDVAEYVPVPLHWHLGPPSRLHGDKSAGYWREDGCPPECDERDGVEPPARSFGVPEGKEGLAPNRGWFGANAATASRGARAERAERHLTTVG